jgi:vacuolar-type H+-ATPase subunit H
MLKNDNIEFCVVDTCHISVYSFSDTRTEAEQKLQDALENNKKDIETWKSHCKNYPDTELFKNYLKEAENKKYEIMTYDEFVQLERNYYLNQPLTEIDKETFDEMLNVLPPLKWCTRHNIEMFCMSEMLTGTYTSQYMFNLVTSKYYHKIVDIMDESTWGYNFFN